MNIRKLNIDDNKDIYNLLSSKQINQYLNIPKINNLDDSLNYINKLLNTKDVYSYVIEENEFIGVFILKKDLYVDGYEFTIYLNKKYWGKGIFNQVLPYFENIVFNKLNIEHFRGYVMEPNISSRRVLENNNYILETTFDNKLYPYTIYTYLKNK